MYKLELSAGVRKDLRKIYAWYEKEQSGLGERFLNHFEESTQQLIENPTNYPVVFRNKRRQVLNIFPYCNYFIIKGDVIRLIAVVHGKRHPQNWKNRRG